MPQGHASGFIAQVESTVETGSGWVPRGESKQFGEHMNRTRMQVLYSGRVQGVGFRYTAKTTAMGFEVTGTIRNLPDGRVELTVEGVRVELEAFRQAIREAGLAGFIRDEQVNWASATGEFRGFEIVR